VQNVETLYRLQVVDLDLEDRGRRLQEVEAHLGESPELLAAREAVHAGEEALQRAEAELREHEFQVSRVEGKLKEVNIVLYKSNPKQTTKELSNLQKEAELLLQQRGKAEDLALADMDRVETMQADLRQLRQQLSEAESVWRREQQEFSAQREALLGEKARLESARADLAAKADPSQLGVYEGLRRQKGGRAVARVEQSLCTGCRISMALQQVQRARSNPGLTFCSSCGRILYVSH
jgi:uncharacterized protein